MIEINNLTKVRINEKFLKKIAQKVLKSPSFVKTQACKKASEDKEKKEFELSIVLVGPKTIQKLNKKHRKKNRPTDVLSYTYNNTSGEIVICPKVVKKNAKKFGQSFEKELTRVLIHGILHLLGGDHEGSLAKAKKMEEKQNYFIKLCRKLI